MASQLGRLGVKVGIFDTDAGRTFVTLIVGAGVRIPVTSVDFFLGAMTGRLL